MYVSDIAMDMDIKVFNLMSKTNETLYIPWHKTCACKCRVMQVFVMIDSLGVMTNADVNAKT